MLRLPVAVMAAVLGLGLPMSPYLSIAHAATIKISTAESYTLSVAVVGSGSGLVQSTPSGIDCGSSCSSSFESNAVVELTATSEAGSTFTGWFGACTGLEPCTVTLDDDRLVTATFSSTESSIALQDLELPPDAEGKSVHVIAVSDDGRYALYEYGEPSSWSLHRRDLITGADDAIGVNQYSFPVMSSDGQFVAFTAPGNELSVWDASNVEEPVVVGSGAYPSISDDGMFVTYFAGGRNGNRLLNRATGTITELPDLGSGVPRLSGDGTLITIGGCCGEGLVQYDTSTGSVVRSLPRSNGIVPLVVSSTGRYVAGLQSGTVNEVGYVWADMVTGRFEHVPRAADGSCGGPFEHSVDIAEDGTWMVLVTNGANGTEQGPNSDTSFDSRGSYFISIGAESITVTGASGVSLATRAPSNNCGTIAASGDGRAVIFSSEHSADWAPPPPPYLNDVDRHGLQALSELLQSKIVMSLRGRISTTHVLSVSKAGSGSGSVTSDFGGVSCGLSCSASFVNGLSVVLTASPATGSSFVGWSGGGCSGTGTCTVSMTEARSVTATFRLRSYKLSIETRGRGAGVVSSSPAGLSCRALCSKMFSYGQSVTLTARPSRGSRFIGWSGGGCSGTGTCAVSMTQARSVTATFRNR